MEKDIDLKKDLTSGVFYTALAKFAGIIITLGVSAVLARKYTPEDFAIINIATVFISFFGVFSDLGLGPAVIQKRDLTKNDIRGIFSTTIWIALILSGVFIALSMPITHFYKGGEPLHKVLLIITVTLFFNTLNMVPNALLMKKKMFRFAAIRSLVVQLIAGGIAITAALMGMGMYALTINPVLSSVAIFAINFSQHPMLPTLFPSKETLKKVVSFSSFQFGFQIVNFFSNNLDKLLMGRFLSMDALGYYDKSYRLMQMPLQNITFVISPVMHPVLAQIQEDKQKIAEEYLKVVKVLSYIGFPLMVTMFFIASDLIFFLFGDQWGPSVPCFKLLSLTIAMQIILSSSGAVFQAANDTKRLFGAGLFSAITYIIAIAIGIFFMESINWVAGCLCVANLLNFMQCYWSLFRKSLKHGWKEFWKTLIKPAVLAVILAGVLLALTFAISGIGNHFVKLAICGIAAAGVTLAYIQISGEYDLKVPLNKIKSKLCH